MLVCAVRFPQFCCLCWLGWILRFDWHCEEIQHSNSVFLAPRNTEKLLWREFGKEWQTHRRFWLEGTLKPLGRDTFHGPACSKPHPAWIWPLPGMLSSIMGLTVLIYKHRIMAVVAQSEMTRSEVIPWLWSEVKQTQLSGGSLQQTGGVCCSWASSCAWGKTQEMMVDLKWNFS